jgi:hypothetical protein
MSMIGEEARQFLLELVRYPAIISIDDDSPCLLTGGVVMMNSAGMPCLHSSGALLAILGEWARLHARCRKRQGAKDGAVDKGRDEIEDATSRYAQRRRAACDGAIL